MKNFFSSPKRAILWMSLSDSEIKISAICRKRLWLPFVAWTTSQFIYFLRLFTFSGSPARSPPNKLSLLLQERQPRASHRRDFGPKDTKRLLDQITWVKKWVEKKKIPFSGEFHHWPAAGGTDGASPSLGPNLKLLFIPGELQDSQISTKRGDEGEGHP